MRRQEANSLDTIAEIDENLGRLDEARRGYRESLTIALEVANIPAVLVGLAGVARMLAREGKSEAALEIAVLALGHSASGGDTLLRTKETLSLLKLSPETPAIAARIAAAKDADPVAVARRLIAEPS